MPTNKRGIELLLDPSLNKSTAFTEVEKLTETEDLQFEPGEPQVL
jgi:hypothetical protein